MYMHTVINLYSYSFAQIDYSMHEVSDSAMPLLLCTCLCNNSKWCWPSFVSPSSCTVHYCMYYNINEWAYFRENLQLVCPISCQKLLEMAHMRLIFTMVFISILQMGCSECCMLWIHGAHQAYTERALQPYP